MSQDCLRIIPLGGIGQIGKNMMVFEYDDQLLIVDCGLMFPESDMLGIDIVIPDMEYVFER
ncbi:MAG: ribonuclease J, partial [Anaerolineae bacterium]